MLCVFSCRFLLDIYRQIWRYGGIQSYIRLLASDGLACVLYYLPCSETALMTSALKRSNGDSSDST